MEIPDEILLNFIKLRCAYFDKKSEEKGTNRVKAKYKLLTQKDMLMRELGIFIFHTLTTTEDSYIKEKTMDIQHADWEYREGTHLNAPISKLCTQKIDCVNKEVLLKKMRDQSNNFSHVATLNQVKFAEVTSFIKESFDNFDLKTDFDVKKIILSMFNKTPISDDVIKKFGI